MSFCSILGQTRDAVLPDKATEVPACFADLNLDQVVDAITSGRDEYDLTPFFYVPLHDAGDIAYRHEIMRDLENPLVLSRIKAFADAIQTMRRCRAQADRLRNQYQKERWRLDGIEAYCVGVRDLARDLAAVELRSRGLRDFRDYLAIYSDSEPFASLVRDTARLRNDLSAIKYSMLVWDSGLTVRRGGDEPDYAAEIEKTFERFKQGAVTDYKITFRESPEVNSVEEKVLEFVARLYADTFKALAAYCEAHRDYLNDTIRSFDREIQFFLAYLDYIATYKENGLSFCYPAISTEDKQIFDHECFDLALARRLNAAKVPIVTNDFYLKDRECILVVSGPNQGGKTTFARTFGQVHYLASLGLPVPGRRARLFLCDDLFTHFEREEDITTLRGALEESLVRMHDILERATSRSIIITNELFASTTVRDAVFLGSRILEEVMKLDALCVCVTFVDELASLSEKTVSMVSTVVPENPAVRTYKIVRKPADGLAWAISIAEKYGLTYERIKERVRP
jgi:DNA mismatch repair protein MutS